MSSKICHKNVNDFQWSGSHYYREVLEISEYQIKWAFWETWSYRSNKTSKNMYELEFKDIKIQVWYNRGNWYCLFLQFSSTFKKPNVKNENKKFWFVAVTNIGELHSKNSQQDFFFLLWEYRNLDSWVYWTPGDVQQVWKRYLKRLRSVGIYAKLFKICKSETDPTQRTYHDLLRISSIATGNIRQ